MCGIAGLIRKSTTVEKVEIDNEIIGLDKIQLNENNSLVVDKDFTELHIFGI